MVYQKPQYNGPFDNKDRDGQGLCQHGRGNDTLQDTMEEDTTTPLFER